MFLLSLAACLSEDASPTVYRVASTDGDAPAEQKATAKPDTGPRAHAPEAGTGPGAPSPAMPRGAARGAKTEGRVGTRTGASTSARPTQDRAKEPERAAKPVALPAKPVATRPPKTARAPSWDWGGLTFLSNDDSMSLASAQRLLAAMGKGRRIDPDTIRPHELLNYFTFDAPTPTYGQTFAVSAAAERTGDDTLALAFTIRAGTPPRQPLDLTLLVDRSGSMNSDGKMNYVKRGLVQLAGKLLPGDRVDLITFDSVVETVLTDVDGGEAGRATLVSAIEAMTPRGSTDMNAGLQAAYRAARAGSGRERRVLLVTDAQLNAGTVDVDTVTEVGAALDQAGVHLSAIGVGSDINDAVLEGLTEKGRGAYVYLGSEPVVDRVFGAMFPALTQTAADDVRFSVDLPPSLAIARFYGEEASTSAADIQPVRVSAGTTQVFLQDLKTRPGTLDRDEKVVLVLDWNDPQTGKRQQNKRVWSVGQLVDGERANVRKARALMAWTDEVRARSAGEGCGRAWTTWEERAAAADGDAEIAYVGGLLSACAPTRRDTALKIKLDSDETIAEVRLRCGVEVKTDALSPSDTVARFADAPLGSCDLVLAGARDMTTKINVTAGRGDVRCSVRDGKARCG